MKYRTPVLAMIVSTVAALGFAGTALAGDHWDNGRHGGWGHHHRHHGGGWEGPRVMYAPPPVIYAPPPRVVYAPPPVVYAAPPVVYEPASPSINFVFPLR
ncbi:MAG TPA: hypothetical protein VK196_11230 [Magnetospirillum sp.]|nr:hypothetical protein [Magnetospirillum sp.]